MRRLLLLCLAVVGFAGADAIDPLAGLTVQVTGGACGVPWAIEGRGGLPEGTIVQVVLEDATPTLEEATSEEPALRYNVRVEGGVFRKDLGALAPGAYRAIVRVDPRAQYQDVAECLRLTERVERVTSLSVGTPSEFWESVEREWAEVSAHAFRTESWTEQLRRSSEALSEVLRQEGRARADGEALRAWEAWLARFREELMAATGFAEAPREPSVRFAATTRLMEMRTLMTANLEGDYWVFAIGKPNGHEYRTCETYIGGPDVLAGMLRAETAFSALLVAEGLVKQSEDGWTTARRGGQGLAAWQAARASVTGAQARIQAGLARALGEAGAEDERCDLGPVWAAITAYLDACQADLEGGGIDISASRKAVDDAIAQARCRLKGDGS